MSARWPLLPVIILFMARREIGMMSKQDPTTDQDEPSAVTIWFDGGCPLCSREIAFMKRLDRRNALHLIDLTEAGTACPVNRELMLHRFHALERGQLLNGAAAFAAMWRAIPILRPLGLLARHRPVLWLLEQLYRGFLKVRPLVQKAAGRGR